MMGGTLFSPEREVHCFHQASRKAVDYYAEGQFHDGGHPVLS